MILYINKLFLVSIVFIISIFNLAIAESINVCIKNAVEKDVDLNKILTLCRENIKNFEVYKNSYADKNNEKSSTYISTNKADEIIYKMIEKGDLNRAARLAERIESEKTKRIKARAEAEALRSPQIISSFENNSKTNENNSAIRSIIALNTNPIKTISAGSKILEVTTPSTHGGIPGQYVTITNVSSSIDGIAAIELNTRHIISSVPSVTTFRISVLSTALAGAIAGGGSEIIATFEN